MKGKMYLGELEKLLILTIMRLGDEASAPSVRAHLKEKTGRDLSVGALYATLDRMEENGLLDSRPGQITHRTGTRSIKYFTVTGFGESLLNESEFARKSLMEGMVFGVFSSAREMQP